VICRNTSQILMIYTNGVLFEMKCINSMFGFYFLLVGDMHDACAQFHVLVSIIKI